MELRVGVALESQMCPVIHSSFCGKGQPTTVVYTVVWRNSVVWWPWSNTALWLAKKNP